jgi:hypothetical protein
MPGPRGPALIWSSPVSTGGASARQGGARKEKAAHEGRPEFRTFG